MHNDGQAVGRWRPIGSWVDEKKQRSASRNARTNSPNLVESDNRQFEGGTSNVFSSVPYTFFVVMYIRIPVRPGVCNPWPMGRGTVSPPSASIHKPSTLSCRHDLFCPSVPEIR